MAGLACGWLASQTLDDARAALAGGRLDDAVRMLSGLVRGAPQDAGANYLLGIAYYRQGRWPAACGALEIAARLAPNDVSVWKALGRAQVAGGNLEGAAVSMGQACLPGSRDAEACYLQGRSLYALARYAEARAPLEQALRTAPPGDLARIYRATALNFEGLGLPEEAERNFRAALRHATGQTAPHEDPRVDYGAFLVRQGRVRDALDPLQRAAAAAPDSVRAQAELGRVLLELDRPQDALAPLQRAVELDPQRWTARLLLGKVYIRLGRTDEGRRELEIGQAGWAAEGYGSSKVK